MTKEIKFGLGAFICVFNKDFSKILLLKRNKEKREKYGKDWGNIGGRIEPREFSIDAVIREAKEEIGIKLNKSKIKLINALEVPNFHEEIHGIQFIYTTNIDENEKITINEESDEAKWFDLNDLPQNTFESKEELLKICKTAREILNIKGEEK